MRPRARNMQLSSTRSSLEDPLADSVLQRRVSILSSSPPLGRMGFGLLRRPAATVGGCGLRDTRTYRVLHVESYGIVAGQNPLGSEHEATPAACAVRALPAGGCLGHCVRLWLVCIFHRNSQSDDSAQLYRRLRDFEPVEHLGLIPRLQIFRIQDEGQLPA